jgi:CheY-like chemotaxis protein
MRSSLLRRKVRWRCSSQGSDTEVSVTVHDTGIGIAPEFMPHVFEPFRQQDGGSTRAYSGLGLGLSIARELVHLHGGTITAQSQGRGRGASFTITFPATLAADRVADTAPSHQPDIRLDGLAVLVVDDDPDTLGAVAALLESHGATVYTAGSAADALAVMVSVRPNVLLADIAMPEQDGYALLAKVREMERSGAPWTPAAALTAYASAEDRARALIAGYQVHIPKPFKPFELVTVVAHLAGRFTQPGTESV